MIRHLLPKSGLLFMALVSFFAIAGNPQQPLIHSFLRTPDQQQVFRYTRVLAEPQLTRFKQQLQLSGNKPADQFGDSQLLVRLPEPLRQQALQFVFCLDSFWSHTWLCSYMAQHITLKIAPQQTGSDSFLQLSLPGSLLLSCSRLQLINGDSVILDQGGTAESPLLEGLELVIIPARASGEQHPASSPDPEQSLEQNTLPLLVSGGGGYGWPHDYHDLHKKKKPPFFLGKSGGDVFPFLLFTAHKAKGFAETHVQSGRPVLRLIARDGLVIEAEDENQRTVFRHYVTMDQAPQWLADLQLDSSLLSTLNPNEKVIITSDPALNVIRALTQPPADRDAETFSYSLPVYLLPKDGKTTASPQPSQGSNTGYGSSARITSKPGQGRSNKYSPDNISGSGGDKPPEVIGHVHIDQGSRCPACHNGLCQCQDCIIKQQQRIPASREGATAACVQDDLLDPEEVLNHPDIGKMEALYLQFGILLGLPAKFLASLNPLHNQKALYSQLLMEVLYIARTDYGLTMEKLLKVLEGFWSGLKDSGLVYYLSQWAARYEIDMKAPLNQTYLQELHSILLPISNQYDRLALQIGIPRWKTNILRSRLVDKRSVEPWLKAVLDIENPNIMMVCNALKSGLMNRSAAACLESWAFRQGVNMLQPISTLNPGLKADLQQMVLEAVNSNVETFVILLRVSDETRTTLQRQFGNPYTCKNNFAAVIREARRRGLLTKSKIFQALWALKQRKVARVLQEHWFSTVTPQPITTRQHWGIISESETGEAIDLASVYSLLCESAANHELITFALNQPQQPVCPDLAALLVQAALDKQVNLKALSLLADNLPDINMPAQMRPANTAETESRPLKRPDLVPLLSHPEAKKFARHTQLLLGIANHDPDTTAGQLWELILSYAPGLETGHLRQLYGAHPILWEAVTLLPGRTQTADPTIPLDAISPVIAEFAGVAHKLENDPRMLRYFSEQILPEPCHKPDLFDLLETVVNSSAQCLKLDFFNLANTYNPAEPSAEMFGRQCKIL